MRTLGQLPETEQVMVRLHAQYPDLVPLGLPPASGIHLTDEDWAILTALADAHPKLLTQNQIEAAANNSVGRRTVQRRLRELADRELVCQPAGKRSGWGATQMGLDVVARRVIGA